MYQKTNWVDHIVASDGNIIQQGTPVNAANLNKIEQGIFDATGIKNYTPGKVYGVDDVVVYEGKIHRCKTQHTASSTLNISYWEVIGNSGSVNNWQTGKYYQANDIVVYQSKIYRAKTAHTASNSFDNDVNDNKLEMIGGGRSEINDSEVSTTSTYSSQKIENTFVKGAVRIFVGPNQPSDDVSKEGDIWIVTD